VALLLRTSTSSCFVRCRPPRASSPVVTGLHTLRHRKRFPAGISRRGNVRLRLLVSVSKPKYPEFICSTGFTDLYQALTPLQISKPQWPTFPCKAPPSMSPKVVGDAPGTVGVDNRMMAFLTRGTPAMTRYCYEGTDTPRQGFVQISRDELTDLHSRSQQRLKVEKWLKDVQGEYSFPAISPSPPIDVPRSCSF
jgi:hypothetical protein